MDREKWGLAFKIVRGKLRTPKQLDIEDGEMVTIINKLFLKMETIRWEYPDVQESKVVPFYNEEVINAVIKNKIGRTWTLMECLKK